MRGVTTEISSNAITGIRNLAGRGLVLAPGLLGGIFLDSNPIHQTEQQGL
jgi:hypothetical protein